MKKIYMDNSATTMVDPEVIKEMIPFFSKKYGNPSSLHEMGRDAKVALENARCKVASLINAEPEEIIFTSGGTESDNLALKGVCTKKGHIITSSIEHPAILNTCKYLESVGFAVTYLPVDKHGFVNPRDVEKAIRKDTIIVSIMHANNEVGTIEPIEEIAKICKKKGVLFHTDAVQSVGKVPIDVKKMNIDLLSISSHKIHGPKGVGVLYRRRGIELAPLIHGGGHELKLRSGTENIPGIVGLGKACEIAKRNMKKDTAHMKKLRDKLIKELSKIRNSSLNGSPAKRLPNNVNFSFKFIEGEALILQLDMYGIAASTGSACSSKSLQPSHVLLSTGLKPEEAHGSLRLSLSKFNTMKEVNYTVKHVKKVVERLRKISPFKGKVM